VILLRVCRPVCLGPIPSRQARLACRRRKRGTMAKLHEAFCACCSDVTVILHRREFLHVAGIGGRNSRLRSPISRSRPKGSTRRWFWPASILACRSRCTDTRRAEPDRQVQPVRHRRRSDRRCRPCVQGLAQAFWDNLATTIQLQPYQAGDRDRPSRFAAPLRSPMARRKSQPRRRKPRRTGGARRIPQASRGASLAARSADRPYGP